MRRSKVIASLAWIFLAFFVCVKSFELGLGKFNKPGPGFMPFLSGSIIALLGLMILVLELRGGVEEIGWKGVNWKKIIMILVGITVYAAVVQDLGYLPTTFLVMVLFFRVIGSQRWLLIFLYSFLSTLAIYLIFDFWLQVPFPPGILDF